MKSLLVSLLVCISFGGIAQQAAPDKWFNLDMKENSSPGISTERTYNTLLQGKESKTIVVAVIDSGVEVGHEDLRNVIWVNEDEIPDNGIDDDNNGYIDDVNGWNFIGGPGGDVHYDNLEFTRVFKGLKKRFAGKDKKDIAKADKADYARYLQMEEQYNRRIENAQKESIEFQQIVNFYELSLETAQKELKKEDITLEDVAALPENDEFMAAVKGFLTFALENDVASEIEEGEQHFNNMLSYSYNMEENFRKVVGDDYSNPREQFYGNNHVEGPAAEHGTHVAGIIAAERGNGYGIDGIADNVRIMVIRCVPDGDERDKDVANAIRYAVDNGAQVINMSFGKSYSPEKVVVDEAMKYAEEKGVLMVHAAGNSSHNNDKSDNFPNPIYEDSRERCTTWIEVGASSWDTDKLVAEFSNYGRKSVDIFAPGVDINSTVPQGKYKVNSGTSMAAPVVSGIAAVLFSYFPELTASDVREIILNSYVDYKKVEVNHPKGGKTKFKKLSRTGGLASLYNAVKMASEWQANQAAAKN